MIEALLITHFVADFLLQPREMGVKKSTHIGWLLAHLLIQFLCFFVVASFLTDTKQGAFWFALANAAIHGVIDWNIWRGYKWSVKSRLYDVGGGRMGHSLMSDQGEWRYWWDHLFYDTIGLDQLLHGLTLIYLAKHILS